MQVLKTALLVLLVSISAVALAAQGAVRKAEAKPDATKETKKEEKKAAVTEAAKTALQTLAGEAKIKVEAEGTNWKAEWTVDGKDNEAIVDAEGKLVRSEIKLSLSDLPEAVRTAVVAKYGEDTFVEFTKITIAKGDKTFYEAESEKKGDTMYNTMGVEVDDDEADEDEDEDEDDDDGEEDDDEDDDDDEEGDDD